MRAVKQEVVAIPQPADSVFLAALGVVQNSKNSQILAVHVQGRKLVVREKSMMSNPKLQQIWVVGDQSTAELRIAVGSDPRTKQALMDGRANGKSLEKMVQAVQAALTGQTPAPASPVANHYLVKKDEVAWQNPEEDPQIELAGNFKAMYGL